MQFNYTPFFPLLPSEKWRKIPLIDVTLIGPKDKRQAKALVDSGAEYNLINLEFVEPLGVNLREAIKGYTYGVVGKDKKLITYFVKNQIKLSFGGFKPIEIIAGFIESDSVAVILGQNDFFENNKVIFEKYLDRFEIKPRF